MPTQTLHDDFRRLTLTNNEYGRNRDRWQFLYESYVGGEEYRRGNHLTRYKLETPEEYLARLKTTPLDNHCNNVVSTYISFLFRMLPDRDFNGMDEFPEVESFLKDCDYEGRSFDAFMKQVAIWTSVFGHCWVMMTKPNIGAATRAQEMELGVRPYVNLMTPLVVSDWRWDRTPTGAYELTYIKYIEEVVDHITVVREWYKDRVETWIMDDREKTAELKLVEANGLGMIPAVLVYNQRSVVKGIGVSDIADIADIQKLIYNMLSENEQAIRLGTHPTIVVPPTAQVGSGAGAMIVLQEGSDPGLNPYALEFSSSSVNSIHSSVEKLVQAIDRISNTGGVRATESRTLSGVALETEFQLLNARLSEKGDNLELAEEQIWRIFGMYQGMMWDGYVKYPDSFSIRDESKEYDQLKKAKDTTQNPVIVNIIDRRLAELLGEDYEEDSQESSEEESDIARAIMDGLSDEQILQLYPEYTAEDIRIEKEKLLNESSTDATRI